MGTGSMLLNEGAMHETLEEEAEVEEKAEVEECGTATTMELPTRHRS
jgi:hypothetical protein